MFSLRCGSKSNGSFLPELRQSSCLSAAIHVALTKMDPVHNKNIENTEYYVNGMLLIAISYDITLLKASVMTTPS